MDEFINSHAEKYMLANNQHDSQLKQLYIKLANAFIDKRIITEFKNGFS
jgi:hypothetical protein